MAKYKLGQKVKFNSFVYKSKGGYSTKWVRVGPYSSHKGIIIGKRTVADGYITHTDNEGQIFKAIKYHSLYLVAISLTTTYHVDEADLEPVNE